MATIREVARIAGVSPSTVSRVMNGTAKVDEEKKQRVMEAISKTNFQPNELARALFKKTSKIIGLVVPDIENPFFSEMAGVIEQEAFAFGYRLLLCNSNNDQEKERLNISMLNQMKADGIILITNSDHTSTLIADCSLPVVVVDRYVTDCGEIAFVEADHYKGGRMATQCLVDCGCRNIICLRGPQAFNSGVLRFQGYLDVCEENGIEPRYIDCAYSYEAGRIAPEELLQRFPDAEGIFACNDMAALSTYKVLRSRGIRVPEDIQLIGFDDINISDLVSPELTTIRQPVAQMGREAIHIIAQYGEGQAFQPEHIMDVELIQRETTLNRKEKI